MKDKDFAIGLVSGAVLGCLFSMLLIFLGSVIRDSIRIGVVSECQTNKKIVIHSTEWACSFNSVKEIAK